MGYKTLNNMSGLLAQNALMKITFRSWNHKQISKSTKFLSKTFQINRAKTVCSSNK